MFGLPEGNHNGVSTYFSKLHLEPHPPSTLDSNAKDKLPTLGSDGGEMQGGLLPVISRGPQLLVFAGLFYPTSYPFVWPFIGVITPTLHGNLTHTLELPPTQDASHHQDYANFIWSPNLNLHLWYHTQELNGTLPTDPDP